MTKSTQISRICKQLNEARAIRDNIRKLVHQQPTSWEAKNASVLVEKQTRIIMDCKRRLTKLSN